MSSFQSLSEPQSFNMVISPGMSSLASSFWGTLTDSRVMRSMDLLGLILATLLLCLWCLQTYKSFKKQGLRPKATEIILPILIIGLLCNDARYLKELTFATKSTVNSIQAPINKVIDEGYRSANLPVTCQNYKSTGRSGIPTENCNLSEEDAMTSAYFKELARKYHNYYSIY